jgi:hypothetical protein
MIRFVLPVPVLVRIVGGAFPIHPIDYRMNRLRSAFFASSPTFFVT